jgi:hypothetical protein
MFDRTQRMLVSAFGNPGETDTIGPRKMHQIIVFLPAVSPSDTFQDPDR